MPSKIAQFTEKFFFLAQKLASEEEPESLKKLLLPLRPQIAAAAQKIVDEWEQDEDGIDEVYGSGGVCDQIANAIIDVINQHIDEIGFLDGGQDGDDHAYVIVYDHSEAFMVDIPPYVYETGGGYSWKKIPGAKITPRDVVIEEINRKDLGLEDEIDPEQEKIIKLREKFEAQFPKISGLVSGLEVRQKIPNTDSISASLENYETLPGIREVSFQYFSGYQPKYYSVHEEKRTKNLAEQISLSQEINPLIVVLDQDGPYILEGGHRFDALLELGIKSFPALVVLDLDAL